jgi:hypothetical protein
LRVCLFELQVQFPAIFAIPKKNSVKIDHARRKVCEIFAIPRKLFENQANFKTPPKSTKCPTDTERERERERNWRRRAS